MKYLVTPLFVLIFTMAQAQDFYDLNTIQTIEITFAESNWDALLDAQKNGNEEYIMAQTVTLNGEVFDSVGVKYKGNSTYDARQVKNPFHIELDTYKDQEYDGYTDIKLSNVAKDPSFLREVLSYQILRQYMDAPLSNYANVYVNGNLLGLYSNSEAISKKFVKSRFGSKKNTFIKCNPIEGAGPGSTDLPDLVYQGQDSTDYYASYELKSDAGWQDLINFCDTLANHTDQIEKVLDVNRALWMLAFNNVLVNLDSYSGGFTQNYYLYKDDAGRFLPVVWDLNESFGQFSMTGTIRLNNTASKQQMTHLLHENDAGFPLIQKLLANPTYKRMYLAHCKTMLLENFDNDSYVETAQELQAVIDASVQADNNKFFTYNNFTANIASDVNGGRDIYPGISTLMDGRSSYLLGLSDFTQTEPTISNIALSTSSPAVNEALSITATITDANNAFLGYRSDNEDAFEQIEMFDDGAHNDGAANDGVYGAEITVNGPLNEYYIYGENDNIGMFSPRRAEHEFYDFTATTVTAPAGDLVINEFMASNDTTASDQDGEFDDWIELYNNTSSAIDLEGYALSDDSEDLAIFVFPAGAEIAANSYLIIWADGDIDQDGLHADFKLSAGGETVFLSDPSGDILDEVTYADQTEDVSFGRFPNGTGDFQTMTPTFNAENSGNSFPDEDQDGFTSDVDCDDNDPLISVEGDACDDGNANTSNDVIQSDCSCAGTTIVSPAGDLVINEFMASNGVTASDQDGEFDDWIELYNNSGATINLEGYALSDDSDDLAIFVFPAGVEIAANGYLIIWADGDIDQDGLHADFKLSAGGETVFLSDASGNILDEVTYADQTEDVSFGRFPNGTGDFQTMTPTFNAQNSGGSFPDNDQDGFTSDVDCDDNDPLISVEGDPCDDGNSNTSNDMIQADCSCAGTTIVAPAGDLVINEFMASNGATASDQDGEFDDWIELYNNSGATINLEGYALSDDSDDLALFVFPAGVEIAANSYLIVWLDGDIDQDGLHADFKLSADGETIFLSNPSGNILDEITYLNQTEDISYGRFPNGTGNFQTMTPTFNGENSGISSVHNTAQEAFDLKAYPNPANNEITIEADALLAIVSFYNLQGQKTLEVNPNQQEMNINISNLVAGMYFIKAVTKEEKVVTRKIFVEK